MGDGHEFIDHVENYRIMKLMRKKNEKENRGSMKQWIANQYSWIAEINV